MTISISVSSDRIAHTTIACENGETFDEVLERMHIALKEVQKQITDRQLCPYFEAGKIE